MNKPQPMNLIQLCQLFEVDINDLPDMKPASMQEMEQKLKKFKGVFKKAYRKLAIKYHPDKGANEQQVKHFQNITSVYRDLAKLKVVPIPRPRPVRVVMRTYTPTYSSTSSTTTGGGYGNVFYWRSSGGGGTSGTSD